MTSRPPPEFYYLAEAYFHQDFSVLYKDLADLTEDVAEGFASYGSPKALKRFLDGLDALTDSELAALWTSTNAQISLASPDELRRVLKNIAQAL